MKTTIFYATILCGLISNCPRLSAQGDSLDIKMVWVEGGSFKMGNDSGEKNEKPVHQVKLNDFYIGQYEVTQALWDKLMVNDPSFFKNCPNCPVEEVTPEEIEDFMTRLNKLTGKHYRLPTEAEWEYAARGGNKSKGYRYSGSNNLQEVGWVKENADGKTHAVGGKKPNELGINDMSGNVWELCSDWWDPAYYKKSGGENPRNDKKEKLRVVRGGSWRSGEERCYNTARNCNIADHHKQNGGFRLAMNK